MVEIGSVAPEFTLATDKGEIRLADYRNSWLVLYFYPKDNTSGCTKEACDFRDRMELVAGHGAALVGVSPDSTASHARFAEKHSLPFVLASDPSHSAAESYGAWGEKSMYGKKYFGIVRSTFIIGPDGIVRALWRKVSVTGHADEVIKRLEELKAQ